MVKASDSKSDSLWERRFESCRLRNFLHKILKIGFLFLREILLPLKWFHSQKYDFPKMFVLNFQDLLSWGYQIAKGMEYLASKRVIHGDLVRTWLAFLPSLNLNLITKWIIKIKSKNNTNRQDNFFLLWGGDEILFLGIFIMALFTFYSIN